MIPDSNDRELVRTPWRRLLEWTPSVIATVLAVMVPLVYWARLPEPMAVHWGTDNMPDGAASRWVDLVMLAVATAVVTLGPLFAARTPMARSTARLLVAVAWSTAVIFGALRLITVSANLDVTVWQQAKPLSGWVLLWLLGASIIAGVVGAWVAGDRSVHERTVAAAVAAQGTSDRLAVWHGGVQGRMLGTVFGVLLLAAIVFSWFIPTPGRWIFAGAMVFALLVLSTMTQAHVKVDSSGLVISMGWFGWPVFRARIDDVVEVGVEDVDPWAYGGWGLRSVPGALAVVLRAGEGIRVERRSGRALVVAVADAAVGAGVLAGHVAGREGPNGRNSA